MDANFSSPLVKHEMFLNRDYLRQSALHQFLVPSPIPSDYGPPPIPLSLSS